jgi:hypothetical protein
MNPIIGWGLAVLAIAVGYAGWGWQGVVLGVTATVFWLLLQFSRSLRVLRRAAGAPVGQVGNAVMLHSRLEPGMLLMQVLQITRSLGRKVADSPETWGWSDTGGDEVQLVFAGGRLQSWTLKRAAEAPAPADAAP